VQAGAAETALGSRSGIVRMPVAKASQAPPTTQKAPKANSDRKLSGSVIGVSFGPGHRNGIVVGLHHGVFLGWGLRSGVRVAPRGIEFSNARAAGHPGRSGAILRKGRRRGAHSSG